MRGSSLSLSVLAVLFSTGCAEQLTPNPVMVPPSSGAFTHTVNDDSTVTTVVDATDLDARQYLDLDTGEAVQSRDGWDLSFRRFLIHTNGGIVTATTKVARHIQTTQRCDACHATRSFVPLNRMDHNEVYGECVSCHDNQTAYGKPVDHPPAGDQCDSCHLTVAFSPVLRFDHAGISSNCASCHDGVTAMGKPANHIPTSNLCEDCHRVNTWSVVTFDHLQAIGTCSGCHDGVLARGKDADHVPTTAECDACHNTMAF